MEMGLKDSSEFYRWQREMEQKDDIEKIERVQMMKIEMELARDQAILAKEKNVQDNHMFAVGVKKEVDKLLVERDHNLNDKLFENKEVIDQIHVQHEKAKVAVKDRHVENRELRDQITKEMEAEQMYLRAEQMDNHLSGAGEPVANILLVHARLGVEQVAVTL